MSASEALAHAGLRPLQDQPAQPEAPGAPFAADDAALTSTNAFSMGQAALLTYDAQSTLNWQDLIYAMELNGMNSSVTPLAAPVQFNRPFSWLTGDASRVLNEISGSYLFNLDQTSSAGVPVRIIQDPESLRALSERVGSAWEAWDKLRSDLATQMNSSDHNPAVTPGWSPSSSPELDTPWFRQYYVKGGPDDSACVGGGVGPATGCQHGYVLSNANWDPYPIDNDAEALTNALANVAVNDDQVPQRFGNTFFTVISDSDPTLPAGQLANSAGGADDYTLADLMAEIQTLQNPVPAQGNAIVSTVEDLQAGSRIKVAKARLDGRRPQLAAGAGPADSNTVDEHPPDSGSGAGHPAQLRRRADGGVAGLAPGHPLAERPIDPTSPPEHWPTTSCRPTRRRSSTHPRQLRPAAATPRSSRFDDSARRSAGPRCGRPATAPPTVDRTPVGCRLWPSSRS